MDLIFLFQVMVFHSARSNLNLQEIIDLEQMVVLVFYFIMNPNQYNQKILIFLCLQFLHTNFPIVL